MGLVMTHIRYEYTEHWTMNILNGAMNIVGLITLETYVDIPRSSNYTNSTSPCTRPRMFLLVFLETNPWPTLYPTLCFWKQLRGRGILRTQALGGRGKREPGIHCLRMR